MPEGGPEDRQNPLIHEGAEPDTEHDSHEVADERATVLQPDGEPLEDTAARADSREPRDE